MKNTNIVRITNFIYVDTHNSYNPYFINVGHSNTANERQIKLIEDFADKLGKDIQKLNKKLLSIPKRRSK